MNKYPDKTQQGWTLPLTWILLLAILALMYFFGWKVVIFLLIAVLVISLGTYLYDKFVSEQDSEEVSFWFHSNQKLPDLWNLIAVPLGIKHYLHDAENIWEWIEAESQDGSCHYNISRKHKDYGYPVHIKVKYQGKESTTEIRETLGQHFANALKTDIKVGSIKYLGGNDFEFTEEGFFKHKD